MLAGAAAEHDGDAGLAVHGGGGLVHRCAETTGRAPRPTLRRMPDEPPAPSRSARRPWQPSTVAVTAGRPAHAPDAPLNAPITMASTYVAGGDLEYGRYGNPTWAAFEDGARRARGRPVPERSRPGWPPSRRCWTWSARARKVVAPRHAYNGTMLQLADLEARGRLDAELVDVTDTDAVVAACEDAALVWLESPTNPALEVADIAAIRAAAHEAGAYVVVDNTFATPLLQQPLDLGADLVVHSATKYLAGHSDVLHGRGGHPRRRAVRRAEGPPRPGRRDPRHVRGLARAARAAHAAPARRAGPGQRPGAGAPAGRAPGGRRGPLPRLRRRSSRSCWPRARWPPTCSPARRTLWVHATSLGGVESTFERRRRWKSEPATIPDGLVRLSVGIEDVDDLWADLRDGARRPDVGSSRWSRREVAQHRASNRTRMATTAVTSCVLTGFRRARATSSSVASLLDLAEPRARSCTRAPLGQSVSALVSRAMKASIISCAVIRPATTASTCSAIGASTPVRCGQREQRRAGLGALGDLPGGGVDLLGRHAPGRASRRRSGCATAARSRWRRGRPARPGPSASAGWRRARSPAGRSRPARG